MRENCTSGSVWGAPRNWGSYHDCSESLEGILDHLKKLEIALHQHEVRTDIKKLMELLHPKFIEIGYSGKTYDFESTLETLASESSSSSGTWSQGYEYIEYSPAVVQVIYLSARLSKDGNLSRHAKRTSIWVNESRSWQIKFHQATPVAEFLKSNA